MTIVNTQHVMSIRQAPIFFLAKQQIIVKTKDASSATICGVKKSRIV